MRKLLIIGSVHKRDLALAKARKDVELVVIDDEFGKIGNHFGSSGSVLADAEAILVRTAKLSHADIDAAARLRVVSKHGGWL